MDPSIGAGNLPADGLDRAIVHGLQCHPRVAFSRLAALLEVSEQTVARRYRRLRSEGLLRVVGVANEREQDKSTWLVRIACRPDGSIALASALAQRDDVGWVKVASGGAEVTAMLRARTEVDRDDLLLQRLPRQATVLGVTMHAVLHQFRRTDGAPDGAAGEPSRRSCDWTVPTDLLTTDQTRELFRERPDHETLPREDLTAGDTPLVAAMALDGRASIASLATATGWSEGRAARRLELLCRSGSIYLYVDVMASVVGLHARASLWLTVEPRHLDAIGQALVEHPRVTFVAALSGPHNLTASVLGEDLAALYDLITTAIAPIEGIRGFELSPSLRYLKQAGSLVEDGRLVGRPAPRRLSRSA